MTFLAPRSIRSLKTYCILLAHRVLLLRQLHSSKHTENSERFELEHAETARVHLILSLLEKKKNQTNRSDTDLSSSSEFHKVFKNAFRSFERDAARTFDISIFKIALKLRTSAIVQNSSIFSSNIFKVNEICHFE